MATETTKYNGKKKRILIVDDEPDVNMVLKKVLEQGGFNVDSYDDPLLALDTFNAGLYDLLLRYQNARNGWFSFVSRNEKDRLQGEGMFFNSQQGACASALQK